jgi:hypothetical protein
VGRVHRGEQRKALEAFDAAELVALRLVFDDLTHPDFVLDLWLPQDEGRRDELPPPEAIAEANRWLARIEALLRRPMTTRRPAAPAVVAAAAATAAPPAPDFAEPAEPFPPLTPLFSRLAHEDDDAPPWDEDEQAEDRRALR